MSEDYAPERHYDHHRQHSSPDDYHQPEQQKEYDENMCSRSSSDGDIIKPELDDAGSPYRPESPQQIPLPD